MSLGSRILQIQINKKSGTFQIIQALEQVQGDSIVCREERARGPGALCDETCGNLAGARYHTQSNHSQTKVTAESLKTVVCVLSYS